MAPGLLELLFLPAGASVHHSDGRVGEQVVRREVETIPHVELQTEALRLDPLVRQAVDISLVLLNFLISRLEEQMGGMQREGVRGSVHVPNTS